MSFKQNVFQHLTLLPGNVWLVPELGRILDKLDIQPAVRTSICDDNKRMSQNITEGDVAIHITEDTPKNCNALNIFCC